MKPFIYAVVGLSLTLLAGASCSSRLDCAKLSIDVCGNTRGCLPLFAAPVRTQPTDPSVTCAMPLEIVSCGDPSICNNQSFSRATDPSGKDWVLQSPCAPAGWTSTSASATVPDCATCNSLSVAECPSADYCQKVLGQQIDDGRSCLLPQVAVDCKEAGNATGTHFSRLVDPAGHEWLVANIMSLPAGWSNSASRVTNLGDCPATDGGGSDGGSDGAGGASGDAAASD